MPMFKKNLKLIATAIGLVAVLVMGLAMPGATQQFQIPNRGQIVQGISQLLATTLTASEGDILDVDNVVFYTDADVTLAYIPLHPSSKSLQLLKDLVQGHKVGSVTVGALYLDNDWEFFKAGVYTIKAKDRFINDNKDLGYERIAVDQEGNEILCGCAISRITRRVLPPTLPLGTLLDFTTFRIARPSLASFNVGEARVNPLVIIAIAYLITVLSDEAQEWYQMINNPPECNKCPCDP
jgi:hypothetical protein